MTVLHWYAIVCALDVLSTLAVLKKGGSEANPVVAWLMKHMDVKPALVISKLGLLAAFAYFWPPDWLWWALIALTGVVVVSNLRVLRKLNATGTR